jgi:3-oxoacyl-[acyl-carrier protein] reductase
VPPFGQAGRVARVTGAGSPTGIGFASAAVLGRLDVVVNNAGMFSAADPDTLGGDLGATDSSRWHRSLARNLDTAYHVSRAALPHLRASDSGRLVLVSSVTGAVMAMRGEVAYATAKAALVVDGGNGVAEQRAPTSE